MTLTHILSVISAGFEPLPAGGLPLLAGVGPLQPLPVPHRGRALQPGRHRHRRHRGRAGGKGAKHSTGLLIGNICSKQLDFNDSDSVQGYLVLLCTAPQLYCILVAVVAATRRTGELARLHRVTLHRNPGPEPILLSHIV